MVDKSDKGTPETLSSLKKKIAELETENKQLRSGQKEWKGMEGNDATYGRLINNSQVGFFITDRSGTIYFANSAVAQLFGFGSREEMLKLKAAGLYAFPEGREEMLKRIGEAGMVVNYEVDMRRRDGSIFNSVLTCIAEDDRLWGIVIDVTDRKLLIEERIKGETRFRELADLLPEVVYEADIHGNILFVNKAGYEKFGYPVNHPTDGLTFNNFVVPEDYEKTKQQRKQALEGLAEPYEYTAMRRDGSTFPVVIHATRYMEQGSIAGTRGLVIDITFQKNTETRLRLNELRLEAMLELSKIKDEPIKYVTDFVLEKAVEITGSTIGYLAFTNEEETFLTMYSWSKTAMEECRISDKPIIYPVNATGLWGEAIRQRKPIITNDYSAPNPHKKGYPEGHVAIRNHMNVPIFDGEHIVMLIGVGNRPGHYDETDVRHLTLLMNELRRIIKKQEEDEQRLRSQTLFNSTINSIKDWIHVLDDQLTFLYMNKALRDIASELGLPQDIEGRSVVDVFPFLSAKAVDEYRRMLTEGIMITSCEITAIGDKSIMTETTKWPVKDETGAVVRIVTVMRDITEKNENEKNLRLSEQKYRSLFTEMMSAFALHELVFNDAGVPVDYRFLDVNPAFEQMTGLKAADIIGKTAKSVIPDLEPEWLENYAKVAIAGEHLQFENYSSSLKKTFEVRAYNAGTNRFAVVFHDITDRKITEDALRESEERYRTVIENTGEGVSIVDNNEIILFANPAAEKIFGVSTGELIGRCLSDFTNEISFELVLQQTELRKMGISSSYEHEIKRPDGDIRTLIVTANPRFNKQGAYIGTFSVFRDITERKQFELDLIDARDKAEQADKLKSAFLANMSHEIRTPLNGILGFASILKMDQSLSEKNRSYLDIIDESGNQLLKLINDIIDISKIEAGQLQIVNKEFPLNYLLAELFNFFENYIATYKQSRLELKLSKGLPDSKSYIIADEYRLRQILTNLISNAVKFTNTGVVEFGYTITAANMIEFFVHDTGIGISPNQVELIFERFRQGDEGIGRKFGGTGLGLAITRELVDLMGGFIWAKPKPDVGTSFHFTLPFIPLGQDKTPDAPAAINSSNYNWSGKTIIIGEDVDASFLFLSILLKNTGITILHARDGREVLDLMAKNPHAGLVLLDIQLPVLNGYEVTKELRKVHPALPIIAQTANAFEEDRSKCLDAGCNDYIAKPIKKDVLLSMIAQYL